MARGATPSGRQDVRPVVLLAIAVLAASVALAAAWGRNRADSTLPEDGPISSDVLVTYVREGGIAGERTRLTVAAGGAATLDSDAAGGSTAWSRQLRADRMAALRTALVSAGFHNLDDSYRPSGACNDCFVDTVTYGGRTVTVQASAVPAELAEILRLLGTIAAED
jgi:hypothetical protein